MTPDYKFFIGSSQFQSLTGEEESGSVFRWLADGSVIGQGSIAEGLLVHFDDSFMGANGEKPLRAEDVQYSNGRWGSALALPRDGRLQFAVTNNLDLSEGTIEMWVALREDGTNSTYTARDHLLFQYLAPNGDFMQVAQSPSGGVIYAGGMVNGEWESAYGLLGSVTKWKAGQWHHLVLTYSASASEIKFYVDGELSAANNEGHYAAPNSNGAIFSIGSGVNSDAADYLIDEVRISGRVAASDEIAERTRRNQPNDSNEIWLSTTSVNVGAQLVFEYTPFTPETNGPACQSAPIQASGIPLFGANPPSTLLSVGATEFTLQVETAEATECAYSVGESLPYDQMTPFSESAVSQHHSTIIRGINPDPNLINDVYVRCASAPDYLLHLQYRALSDAKPSFPRKGNLWGWTQWADSGLSNMAKVDLWLGVAATPEQIVQLRHLNPNIRLLTSINAVEGTGLPDDYYLKDVNGNRIEVWPGSYRLNLTKDYVAEYQARHAYQTILNTGLMADGVFFDNFMTTQSWLTNDIYGDPVELDADEDGVPDDPAQLDQKWKQGIFHEMLAFRELMPNAIANGHSMDINEEGISDLFNGISVGFATAHVLEGKQTFDSVFARYNQWMSNALAPQVTMIESSPMEQIAYGYGYANAQRQSLMNGISDSTLEFARTYYPYMRFGLAFTMMNDGYFTHEFGDIWHGNYWWYDELDYNLGYPVGPARKLDLPGFGETNLLHNGSFESAGESWQLVSGPGCAAQLSWNSEASPIGTNSARIDIGQTTGIDWHIEFAQENVAVSQGVTYDLTFWVRSDAPRTITLNGQKQTPDWENYGLSENIEVSSEWEQKIISFQANATVSDMKVQFFFGASTGTVWIAGVRMSEHPPTVLRRDFNHGTVLLNASDRVLEIPVGAGYKRLKGEQAPKHQLILDDSDSTFQMSGDWEIATYDTGLWKASGPYYHAWRQNLHQTAEATATASWLLPIVDNDTYTISVWWPAAPAAKNWSTNVLYEIVSGGEVVARTNFNQQLNGDEWHELPSVFLSSSSSNFVRVSSPDGPFVADAIEMKSAARYNDGQSASTVKLQPMDGILLATDESSPSAPSDPVPQPALTGISVSNGHLIFTIENLTPGISYSLQRRNSLGGNSWEDIQDFRAESSTAEIADAIPIGFVQFFYRIQANP